MEKHLQIDEFSFKSLFISNKMHEHRLYHKVLGSYYNFEHFYNGNMCSNREKNSPSDNVSIFSHRIFESRCGRWKFHSFWHLDHTDVYILYINIDSKQSGLVFDTRIENTYSFLWNHMQRRSFNVSFMFRFDRIIFFMIILM